MNTLDDLARKTAQELTALRRDQRQSVERGRAMIDDSKRGDRAWTKQEGEEFRRLMDRAHECHEALLAKFEDLGGTPPVLDDEERILAWLGESRNDNRNPTEGSGSPVDGGFRQPYSLEARKMDVNGPCGPDLKSRRFAALFGLEGRALDKGGFKNFNDFLSVLHEGRHDPRLSELRTMTGSIPADGGFAIPTEFAGWLLDKSLESEIVRPRCQVWPMAASERVVPAWDAADRTGGLFGGITGTWLAENATASRVQPKLRQMTLKAKKLAIYCQASNELREDGLSLESQLGSAMIAAVGWYLDYAALRGTGAGQPHGLLNTPALVTADAKAGQVAGTLIYENVCAMFARLLPALMDGAVWLANPTTIPSLLCMAVNVGTGGSAVPVLRESSGKFYLLGKEVIFTEKMPVLGDKGDICLVNFSGYAMGLRKEVVLDKSNVPGWLSDASDYRTIIRVDGMGLLDKAITPKNGDTQSWAVTLAARA